MPVPFSQMVRVARHVLGHQLAGHKRFPLVLMLEPLYRCNLACAGCGKIQYPSNVLRTQLSVEECMRAVDEVVGDPQVVANDVFSEFDHPAAGRVRHHRPPTRFHGTPCELREPAAPTLGQHSDEIVAQTGRADLIDKLRAAGVIQ